MSASAHNRREALRGAALGAGAIAAAGLLRPALAGAQAPADEDLRDFLVEAISLEQLAVLAYATAARDGGTDDADQLETFRDQEQAHANALRNALDSLGFDLPEAPDSPTDTGAFEDVEGLSTESSENLLDLLAELDGLSGAREYYEFLAKVEDEQLTFYTAQGPTVESVDLTITCAEIAGCQAQHAIVLGAALEQPPERTASAVGRTAAEAIPAPSAG